MKMEKIFNEIDINEFIEIKDITYCPDNYITVEYFKATAIDVEGQNITIESNYYDLKYSWQRMLDLNIYEEELESVAILGNIRKTLIIAEENKILNLFDFFDEYILACDKIPALWMLLNDVFLLFKACQKKDINEINQRIKMVDELFMELETKIYSFKKYLHDSIITPYENGVKINPLGLLLGYELYSSSMSKESILATTTYYHEGNYIELIQSGRFIDILGTKSRAFTEDIGEPYLRDEDFLENNLAFFDNLFLEGIQYLIESEQIPKKCKLCSRYFLNKYSYVANYCNVPYRETKETCQVHASKAKYKSKTLKSPIYNEYSKVYNRIYSRVRRGSMIKDEARLDKLKKLKDEYTLIYEMELDDVGKKKVLNRFKFEIDRLYMTDDKKHEILLKLNLAFDMVMLFNKLAINSTLDEFRLSLEKQLDYEVNDAMKEILFYFQEVTERMTSEFWYDVQCALPFDDPI